MCIDGNNGEHSAFKIYQVLESSIIRDRYTDDELSDHSDYFQNIYFDSSSTFFQSDFQRYSQKTGVLGTLGGWNIGGHLRSRWLYANLYEDGEEEWLFGGTLEKRLKIGNHPDSIRLKFEFEQMLDDDARLLDLSLQYRYLSLRYQSVNRKSAIVENRMYNNHFIWDQQLGNEFSNSLEIKANFESKLISIRPFARWDIIDNYIYYGKEATPVQAQDAINILGLGGDLDIHLGKFHLLHNIKYTTLSGPDVIRFPELLGYAKYYLATGFRPHRMELNIGFEFTYRSAYFGHDYMPANFQFFLQDDFRLDEILIPDFFLSLKFRSAEAFIAVPYFTQGWASPGYFTTPYYTGYTRPQIIEFGFVWRFFD